jgi:hypothetical protein
LCNAISDFAAKRSACNALTLLCEFGTQIRINCVAVFSVSTGRVKITDANQGNAEIWTVHFAMLDTGTTADESGPGQGGYQDDDVIGPNFKHQRCVAGFWRRTGVE